MIFDWASNSEKIDQTGRLSASDKWERKHSYQQQECYVRHELEKGMDSSTIKTKWLLVMTKSDPDFRSLSVGGKSEEFRILLSKSIKLSKEFWEPKNKQIAITENELSYINALECPRWFRKYVLLILGYYKFEKAYFPTAFFPSEISGWAYEKAREGENIAQRRLYRATIWPDNKKCGNPIVLKPVSGKLALALKWASKGEESSAVSFLIPNDLLNHFDLVKTWTVKCERCGKEFVMAEKQKTRLCPKCYNDKFR